jgi:hypothetical protein
MKLNKGDSVSFKAKVYCCNKHEHAQLLMKGVIHKLDSDEERALVEVEHDGSTMYVWQDCSDLKKEEGSI